MYRPCPMTAIDLPLSSYAPRKLQVEGRKRSFFDSCLLDLKSWLYRLPSQLKLSKAGTPPNKFPQAYTLCMVYHTTIILLAKPYLQVTAKSTASQLAQSPSSQRTSRPDSRELPDHVSVKANEIYLDSAQQICSIGDQYRQAFGSFRQSPITATHCTLSASIALLYHCNQRRAVDDSMKRKFESCVQTLQELSRSWAPARSFFLSLSGMIQRRLCSLENSTGNDRKQTQTSATGSSSLHDARLSVSPEQFDANRDNPLAKVNWNWPSFADAEFPLGDLDVPEELLDLYTWPDFSSSFGYGTPNHNSQGAFE